MAAVLVDTSVWIEFLRDQHSVSGNMLADLLKYHQVLLCGIVEAELMHGLNPHQAQRLRPWLDLLPYLELERKDYQKAGHLLALHRSKGKSLPLSDALIAALALRHGVSVLTLDKHFQSIESLSLLSHN
jgi:predicted nucleic acid-binding protein